MNFAPKFCRSLISYCFIAVYPYFSPSLLCTFELCARKITENNATTDTTVQASMDGQRAEADAPAETEEIQNTETVQAPTDHTPEALPTVLMDIAQLRTSPYNPRTTYEEEGIKELAATLRESGLLHPLHVRPKDGYYEIITGERRFHAARLLGWKQIAVYVREATDAQARDMALTENLQREDMAPMDEARAYKTLVSEGADIYTLAAKYGKSDRYIYDRLKLNDLIPAIADLLSRKMIGLGIALEVSKCEKFIQQDLYENHLKGSAEDDTPQTGWRGKGLADFRRLLQDAYTSDLTRYAFDKSDCLHCVHNTNTYDMFAETNSCGHCTDRECLQAKNAAFVLEKSRALLKVDPRIVVANCSYGYTNPVVRQNLEEEGHTVKKVGFGYRTLPAEPQAPQAEQFREANEYEQAVVRYEMQRQEYEQTLQEALQQAEAGAIRLMVSPEPTDARLIAIPVNHREKEPDFVKRLSQEKQANVERAITKTVEDTRKMMRKEQMEAPVFSAFDENVLLYCLLDALRHDHLALFGEKYRESHYLTDADKLEIVKNLTPEQRDIIRHDYIVEALSKKGESKIVGQMIMEYANIHYNRQFSLIKAGHEETCENRNDRLDERIAEFQAKERVKKEQEKKKRKKQAVTETQAVTAVSAA